MYDTRIIRAWLVGVSSESTGNMQPPWQSPTETLDGNITSSNRSGRKIIKLDLLQLLLLARRLLPESSEAFAVNKNLFSTMDK